MPVSERIQRELRGEGTGFDALMQVKRGNLTSIVNALAQNPKVTRRELASELKVSLRTLTRYLSELRRQGRISSDDRSVEQTKARALRVLKLKRLLKFHPEYNRIRLCHELHISRKTLYRYLAEVMK
jgi:predicted DNA-binding transcriptional regulator YafY